MKKSNVKILKHPKPDYQSYFQEIIKKAEDDFFRKWFKKLSESGVILSFSKDTFLLLSDRFDGKYPDPRKKGRPAEFNKLGRQSRLCLCFLYEMDDPSMTRDKAIKNVMKKEGVPKSTIDRALSECNVTAKNAREVSLEFKNFLVPSEKPSCMK